MNDMIIEELNKLQAYDFSLTDSSELKTMVKLQDVLEIIDKYKPKTLKEKAQEYKQQSGYNDMISEERQEEARKLIETLESLPVQLIKESESCDCCNYKCNLCVHKDEQIDIGDSWENEIILVNWCVQTNVDRCTDFKTDWNYCPKCGNKL